MTSPNDEPHRPVSLEELANLEAGWLSAEEEAEVRMRMAHDPDLSTKLSNLHGVDELLRFVPDRHESDDMPPEVAARIQAVLAEEALRRSRGEPTPDDDFPPPPVDGVPADDDPEEGHASGPS